MRADPRRPFVSLAAWLAGAAVAVTVSLLALTLIGDGLSANEVAPLAREVGIQTGAGEPDQSDAAPASGPVASSPAVPSATPASRSDQERVLGSRGGSVLARCHDGLAYLISWSPAQGYRAHDVHRGPAAVATVSFRSSTGEWRMTVRCDSGTPRASVRQGYDDDYRESSPSPHP